MHENTNPEAVFREILRKTRRKFSAEEKIRTVLEGLKGEESISEICRRESISPKRSDIPTLWTSQDEVLH